jgi:hypothetical protein
MAQGTTLSASGTGNTLHVNTALGSTLSGAISGFQTVYYHTRYAPTVEGASVLYVVADDPGDTTAVNVSLKGQGETLILKDTANALVAQTPVTATGTKIEVHLQNYQGAPTTAIAANGPGQYMPNGGAIGIYANAGGVQDNNATLIVHVDTDSTAGLIYGWGTNAAISANYRYPVPNLVIDGAGKLTAQISNVFTSVDARQAGDLNLTYSVDMSTTGQVVRLGDGTNTLNLVFQVATSPASAVVGAKIYLGAGADTIALSKGLLAGQTEVSTFSNLHIKNGATLDGPSEIIGFQKGADHLVLDALVHTVSADVQVYADGKTTLQDALIAVSAHVAINSAAVFTWNGDTYVYAQDSVVGVNMGEISAPGDGLLKLVGVTGLTVGTGAGAYDIHYG